MTTTNAGYFHCVLSSAERRHIKAALHSRKSWLNSQRNNFAALPSQRKAYERMLTEVESLLAYIDQLTPVSQDVLAEAKQSLRSDPVAGPTSPT